MKLPATERIRRVWAHKDVTTFMLQLGWTTVVSISQWFPVNRLHQLFEARKYLFPNLSDANPCDLIYVDPNTIEYFNRGPKRPYGSVVSGSWDRTQFEPLDDHSIYQSIRSHFLNDVPWRETSLYKVYHEQIQSGDPNWKCPTESDLHQYLSQIDQLYQSIQERGYKTQRELLEDSPRVTRRSNNDAIHPILNEVTVDIARDGTIAKSTSGDHRLAIAKVLNLNEIPVVVRTRHKQWQAVRNDVLYSESRDELDSRTRKMLDHPDLHDLLRDCQYP